MDLLFYIAATVSVVATIRVITHFHAVHALLYLIVMLLSLAIIFFLLIFFLVTSLQALEAVMNLPTPQSAEGGVSTSKSVAELENDPNYITVRIEDDDSIWVEDTQVFNDHDLAIRLRPSGTGCDKCKAGRVQHDFD